MEYVAENRKLAKSLNDPRLLLKNFGRDRTKKFWQGLMSLMPLILYSKFHPIRHRVAINFTII